jgi:hypothetical protein
VFWVCLGMFAIAELHQQLLMHIWLLLPFPRGKAGRPFGCTVGATHRPEFGLGRKRVLRRDPECTVWCFGRPIWPNTLKGSRLHQACAMMGG